MNNSNTNILSESLEFVKNKFDNELPKSYHYHNYDHTLKVVAAAEKIAEYVQLNPADAELLKLAAIFHDTGYINDPDNHEEESAGIARFFLSDKGYGEEQIKTVEELILSTKVDAIGKNKLENYIKDSDLSGLADEDYASLSERLRQELIDRSDVEISKNDWLKQNIKFFQAHEYNTLAGMELFQVGKKNNLKNLKKMREVKKKVKEGKLLTIGSSKSAQTQLKTALRNHIDLSAIADNKANIMLSVNAIVITVGLPLILENIAADRQLVIPTIILALASLTSMVFATLSTRPAKMSGNTSSDQIKAKKSNLFFFGNYYRMNFDEYEEGMRAVVADSEILDNSITRDLFFLGKSLGRKYDYLRWCYNIFMYGVGAAILSYIIIQAI